MSHIRTNVVSHTSPYYSGMTDDQCRLIHRASLDILERTGVLLHYQPALNLLKKAGCIIENNHVRVPTRLVEWALRSAPSRIMLYDRNGTPAMPLGDRISTYGTGSDCLYVLDHRTDTRRRAILQDIVDGVRVADSLPHIDFIMSMFLPSDAPAAAEVLQMETMLKYSAKPICFVTYEFEGLQEIIEMLETAMGGKDQLRITPTAILYLNPTTAFNHNEEALQKLMVAAERNIPTVYLPDVQRGFSCPITFAGAMACANAGQLVGLVISQLTSEGAPMILNAAAPSSIDMKTMVLPYGTPEGGAYALEMNHYYNLPTFNTGGISNSKVLDEQAIMEASLTLQQAAITGGNMIHDVGYMESGMTNSLELLVICNEAISWIKANMKELEINEETLALELIHENALSGTFLESDHTLAHIKEEWSPHLIDRQNFEMWFEGGATTMRSRARAIIDEILKEDPTSILAPETEKKINAISKKILESNGE